MTSPDAQAEAGDQATVTVSLAVQPDEAFDSGAGETVIEIGRTKVWDPPGRLLFEWRNSNFAPAESTEVEVRFAPSASGTRVTVVHRGWSRLRFDHPARHGLQGAAFSRSVGLWWGDQMASLRERSL